MLKLFYYAVTAAMLVSLLASFQRQAHAYVDPGSSLLALQSLSSMFAGALFFFRRRLQRLLRKPSARTPELPSSISAGRQSF